MTRYDDLMNLYLDLKACLDALEGRKVEPSDREYMRLFLRGDKQGRKGNAARIRQERGDAKAVIGMLHRGATPNSGGQGCMACGGG